MPSELMKSLPTIFQHKLREPSWIAAIASVGVHGILWVLLPILPTTSSPPPEPGVRHPVEVVEMTPEEQSRIPDLSRSELLLPPAPPPDPDLFRLTPLPNASPIPTPSTRQYRLPSSIYVPSTPRYSSRTNRQQTARVQQDSSTDSRSNPNSSSGATDNNPVFGETVDIPELGNLSLPDQPSNQDPEPGTNSDNQATTPSESAPPAPNPSEDIIAQNRELQALLQYDPTGTSYDEGRFAAANWVTQTVGISGVNPNQEEFQETIVAVFPEAACVLRRTGRLEEIPEVRFGVVVDADGKLIEDLTQELQSSGYEIFDLAAEEAINTHEFDPEKGHSLEDDRRLYFTTILFEEPESCPSNTPPAEAPAS